MKKLSMVGAALLGAAILGAVPICCINRKAVGHCRSTAPRRLLAGR